MLDQPVIEKNRNSSQATGAGSIYPNHGCSDNPVFCLIHREEVHAEKCLGYLVRDLIVHLRE